MKPTEYAVRSWPPRCYLTQPCCMQVEWNVTGDLFTSGGDATFYSKASPLPVRFLDNASNRSHEVGQFSVSDLREGRACWTPLIIEDISEGHLIIDHVSTLEGGPVRFRASSRSFHVLPGRSLFREELTQHLSVSIDRDVYTLR